MPRKQNFYSYVAGLQKKKYLEVYLITAWKTFFNRSLHNINVINIY